MFTEYKDLLERAYALFNAREIESLLRLMEPDVHWPNGWEGGYVKGHEQVRDYWTRQWREIDPTVRPIDFVQIDDERVDVKVHQVVKDLEGRLLFEGNVHHVYTFENARVKSMEIISLK